MADKRKKLIRQLMKETGRSYCSILNELRRGDLDHGRPASDDAASPPPLRASLSVDVLAPKVAQRAESGGQPSGAPTARGNADVTDIRMPRVFSFVGSRGGAGKTTAAILCAIEWLNRGCRVLFVDDADEQFHAAAVAVFVGRARSSPRMVSLLELLQRPKLARGFDIVVIDAPSGAPDLQKALLALTDVAIMPVGPRAYDRETMLGDFAILTSARQSRPTLQTFVLLNRCRPQDRTTPVEVRGDAGAPTLSTRLSDFAGHQDLQGGQSARAKQERRRLVNELDSLVVRSGAVSEAGA